MRRTSLLALTIFLIAGVIAAGAAFTSIDTGRPPKPSRPAPPRPTLPPAPRTVDGVVKSIGSIASSRYRPVCRRKHIAWPPAKLTLIAFKRERLLEVWGAGKSGGYARLATYKILAASGGAGPKRREGDRQVPEGFYRLTELNPNSLFHLSIRVDYPNAEDIRNSKVERGEMGGDIYIHGNRVSIGCLALGDRAIEELFPLVAQVPAAERRIIIAPFDFRRRPNARYPKEAAWVHKVYDRIKRTLTRNFRIQS